MCGSEDWDGSRQLVQLAQNYGVPVNDEDALIALGRRHQRQPAPEGDYVVPVNIALEVIHRQYQDHDLQFQQRNRKFKEFQDEGARIVGDLIRQKSRLREFILQTSAALEPVLSAPWHGKDGINLTAEQSAAIQDSFGDDWAKVLSSFGSSNRPTSGCWNTSEMGKPQASAAVGLEPAQEESNDLCV